MEMDYRKEKDIQQSILHYLNLFQRKLRVWRNNTGAATFGDSFVHFGLKGQADISGIIAPTGVRLEIEVKRPKRKQTKHQVAFQKMIEQMGGKYILATSIDDVRRALPGLEPDNE
jgi:hypothetical protein